MDINLPPFMRVTTQGINTLQLKYKLLLYFYRNVYDFYENAAIENGRFGELSPGLLIILTFLVLLLVIAFKELKTGMDRQNGTVRRCTRRQWSFICCLPRITSTNDG